MKQVIVTFLFFLSFFYSNAQKTDNQNLDKLSKKIHSFEKLKILDSALFYSNELLSKSIVTQDTFYELKAYNNLAKNYRLTNSPFKSVKYYTKSKELNLIIGDTNSAINKLRRIVIAQNSLGDFNSSENTAIEALKLTIGLPDSLALKQKLGLYNSLGIATKRLKNYDDAIIWYNKALEISIDSLKIITLKNNIAVAYIKQGEYKIAMDALYKILEYPIIKKKLKQKARVIDNLAFVKSKLNFPEAEKELIQALQYREEINDLSGEFASNIHLTKHYQDQNLNKKALTHANNAYKIANKLQSETSKTEALSYLIKLKDNPKAEAIEFEKLNDSINIARQQAKNQFAKIKYETDQYRERVLELKTETAENALKLTKEKSRRNVLILISFILLGGVFFILYSWRQRIKTARIQERQDTNKRLSKKLHDEVGNDLYYLLLQLQKVSGFTNDQENLKILHGFDSVYHKVRDFSRDHKIETGEEYGDELLSLLDAYGDQNTKVVTSDLEPDFWKDVTPTKKEELYWVLKELLTNMKRHSKATIVAVTFTKEKKQVVINYVDNGIGIDLEQPLSKNGLHNVKNRIKDINGTITFDTKPKEGFKATIVFTP
ncbi:tetratricopeptide repeat-containing sensor histidine kinase [Aquimarina algiphila]|uniref:tetratricopeptide repeat-containing sensor histidine kinase n=1 Tax=Aquimarina algiphila TaxID=2047982 RepID=UPI0024932337|nr:ATP-binding protein [Aquimarina algiphila]